MSKDNSQERSDHLSSSDSQYKEPTVKKLSEVIESLNMHIVGRGGSVKLEANEDV